MSGPSSYGAGRGGVQYGDYQQDHDGRYDDAPSQQQQGAYRQQQQAYGGHPLQVDSSCPPTRSPYSSSPQPQQTQFQPQPYPQQAYYQAQQQQHHHQQGYPYPMSSGMLDPTSEEYDPAIDPQLQLRSVRTAAESIAESHRSEARRDAARRRGKLGKHKKGESVFSKLGRGMSLRRGMSKKANNENANGNGEKPGSASALAEMVEKEFSSGKEKIALFPRGAQGTGGEGVGVAFDSAQQDTTPFAATAEVAVLAREEAEKEEAEAQGKGGAGAGADGGAGAVTDLKKKKKKPAKRRTVYLNMPLPRHELKKNGVDPLRTYPRNKVRTSKYTVVSFLPRFLYEQFRRAANVYFLILIVLQVRQEFTAGATVPQIAMLPLLAILTITAIKDSIEDYRRHALDNEVNNSAVTRLGAWRNVNQAKDPRNFLQRLLGVGGAGRAPNKVSKGVRKLREKEDAIGLTSVAASSGRGASIAGPVGAAAGGGRPRAGSVTSTAPIPLETIASESERLGSEWGGQSQAFSKTSSQHHLINHHQNTVPSMSYGTAPRPPMPPLNRAASRVDGVIDYGRHAPGTAKWERTLWKKLEVGDIVLLREDDQVPADIVVLNSSDPDKNAYIETKNLDGETNLKVRKSLKCTTGIQSDEDVEYARFQIDSEPPHANLYAYNGVIKYYSSQAEAGTPYEYPKEAPLDSSAAAAGQTIEPVTINELLLRGCILRNTDWVIGMVLFTGEDTKIMLNGGETPSKRSKIEKETNFNVLFNFVLLTAMCLTCAIVAGLDLSSTTTSRYWYEQDSLFATNNVVNAVIIFFSCMVVFQNIVPISLYISIEIVKTIQAFFIYQDIEMYYEPLDHPCVPKTWNISDDLGQIEYIFSDKTGTLTQNVMEFKKCSVNGIAYGEGITEAMVGAMRREGKDTSALDPETQQEELNAAKDKMNNILTRAFKNRYLREDKATLISPSLAEDMTTASPQGAAQRKDLVAFFRALALCHTALADRPDASDPFKLDYKAQSPDEAALVAAARDVGAVFLNKNNQQVDIEVMGQPERYTPLKVLEFNSTRKRMSTIIREPDGRILMICKGADSVIYQRLRADHDVKMKESTQKDLEDFANAGLRTLCIAYRYLDEAEYLEWAKIHDEAAASLHDRDELVDEAAEAIEVDLTLMGATALEDKLQVGVPDAIATLHKAGIKLWILTGDKLQTAIEIGFSCNLLTSDMEIMIISSDHAQGTRAQIEAACNKIAAAGRPVVVNGKKSPSFKMERQEDAAKGGFAVVIDGETLKWALSAELKPLFLALTTQCEAVVCCRVSPAQKALTVKLVKDGCNAMTLAIGDGANDVAMIQEAHCGVGIAGLEGAQASMSADYAIGQFRYLTKLLLVHGHWSVVRISRMHVVFFFKNLCWTATLFFFMIFNGFDGTYLYEYTYILLFNLVFTSLAVLVIGSLDQDVNNRALMAVPQTYRKGREGGYYPRYLFYITVIDALYQGAVCFFIPWAICNYFPAINPDGHDAGATLWLFGTMIGAAAVVCANLIAGLLASYWTWMFWAVEIVSILSYFVWAFIYSAWPGTAYTNTAFYLLSAVLSWATILLCVIVAMLPRYAIQAWIACFHPSDCDIIREQWIAGDLKDQLGIAHRKEKKNLRAQRKAAAAHDMEEQYRHDLPQNLGVHQHGRQISEETTDSSDALADEKYRSNSQHLHPEYTHQARAPTGMSYYDPDMLAPSSPGHADSMAIPSINVQRASGASYNNDPGRQGGFSPYVTGQFDAANSKTALAQRSVDSFDQHFNAAFGIQPPPPQQVQQQQRSTSAGSTKWREPTVDQVISPAERYHERFRKTSQPTPAQAFDESRHEMPSEPDGHPRDASYKSELSCHTAAHSDDYR